MRCPRCGATHPDDASRCPACGAASPAFVGRETTGGSHVPVQPPLSRVVGEGTRLGSYRLGRRIGEGGMSAVYEAWDEALDRRVAVKVLHPNLVGDAGIRRRFLREGRITNGWSHPNVVPVLDTVATDEVVALVMQRVDGPTLADVAAQWRGGMPERELAELAVGLLDGLAAAHARGVVHRDLKPGNVLVAAEGGRQVPRIIDFGIARVLEGTTYTLTGAVLGTCRYMSPEQVRGEPVDERSDLYALGIVLYELATGQSPFAETQPYALMMAHTSKEPRNAAELRPDLSPALVRAIHACLAKDPDARPESAEALRRELADALSVTLVPPAPRTGDVGNGHDLRLVPAGTFLHGADRREVWLDAFAIDRLPVTNAQYHAFVRATGYRPDDPDRFLAHWPSPAGPSRAQREHPVVFVSLRDAAAYAGWLGLRLPSEAEWEKAARGTDGRRYPWGSAPPTLERAWFGQRTGTAPVGARPAGASPYGVEDLVGLVWEWCSDEDDPVFAREGPAVNPRRPVREAGRDEGVAAVVRGGAWIFDDPKAMRTTTRAAYPPDARLVTVGFRCAR
ncbi:MAG: SUMF1/EgtB/PvdO family nonheme iron enzyme [Myxococcota bacterium]